MCEPVETHLAKARTIRCDFQDDERVSFKHTDADFKLVADVYITYEIELLVIVLPIQAQWPRSCIPSSPSRSSRAFLVHLRSLADFVVAPRKHEERRARRVTV